MSSLKPFLSTILSMIVVGLIFLTPYSVLQSYKRDLDSEIGQLTADILTWQSRITKLRHQEGNGAIIPNQLILKSKDRNSSEIALQDIVVELAQKSNFMLRSFGSAPLSKTTQMEAIGFQIEFEAALSDLYEFLANLEQQTPRLAVEDLNVRQASDFTRSQVLIQGSMIVWTFVSLSG